MNSKQFSTIRRHLGKTQREMAQLLGTSSKSIQSFDQGWRNIPVHIERQLYFLLAKKQRHNHKQSCWVQKKCPKDRREHCPAWEYQCGDFCWFINGTICQGKEKNTWSEKMKHCRKCEVFRGMISFP